MKSAKPKILQEYDAALDRVTRAKRELDDAMAVFEGLETQVANAVTMATAETSRRRRASALTPSAIKTAEYAKRAGVPISQAMVAAEFGISHSAGSMRLRYAERAGLLTCISRGRWVPAPEEGAMN